VHLGHGPFEPQGAEQLNGVGGLGDREILRGPGGRREPTQDMVGALLLAGWLADPDADPEEVLGAEHLGDGAESVMAG